MGCNLPAKPTCDQECLTRTARFSARVIYQCPTPVLQAGPPAAHNQTTHNQPWAATNTFLPKQGNGPPICCGSVPDDRFFFFATFLVTIVLRQSCRNAPHEALHQLYPHEPRVSAPLSLPLTSLWAAPGGGGGQGMDAFFWKPPLLSMAPSLCPATVSRMASASLHGICNRQQPPPTALATSSNRLSNRLWGRLWPHHLTQQTSLPFSVTG